MQERTDKCSLLSGSIAWTFLLPSLASTVAPLDLSVWTPDSSQFHIWAGGYLKVLYRFVRLEYKVVAVVEHKPLALFSSKGWDFVETKSGCLALKLLSYDLPGTPDALQGVSFV